MRILYNYKFDVTKCIKREELIPVVLDYLNMQGLVFDDILFRLYSYKTGSDKRRKYVEKLCLRDEFWQPYKNEYECNFAKDTYLVEVSNLENGSWERKNVSVEDAQYELITKIQEQFVQMPKVGCSYEVALDKISWYNVNVSQYPISDPWTASQYPLSSNITIWEDYLHKRYIVLNFEMPSENYETYVDAFANQVGCIYEKDIMFVKNECEWEICRKAEHKIQNILSGINKEVDIRDCNCTNQKRYNMKSILNDILAQTDYQFVGVTNGLYEFCKIDQYNNRIKIFFDHEKSRDALCATITYVGNGYKHSIMYSDMKVHLCFNTIKEYAMKILDEVNKFELEYVPLIVNEYMSMC